MAKKETKFQPLHVSIDSQTLKTAIESVLPAASTDETRPHLNSLCLEAHKSFLVALASNGAVLARYEAQALDVESGFRLTVPLHVVKRLRAVIGKDKGTTSIIRDEKRAVITLVGEANQPIGTLDVLLGDGLDFPDTDPAWPTGDHKLVDTMRFTPVVQMIVARCFKAAAGDSAGITYEFRGPVAPVVATAELVEAFRMLVMPYGNAEQKDEAQAAMFEDEADEEEETEGDADA